MGGFGWIIVLLGAVFVGLLSVGCLCVGLWNSGLNFGCLALVVVFVLWFDLFP